MNMATVDWVKDVDALEEVVLDWRKATLARETHCIPLVGKLEECRSAQCIE